MSWNKLNSLSLILEKWVSQYNIYLVQFIISSLVYWTQSTECDIIWIGICGESQKTCWFLGVLPPTRSGRLGTWARSGKWSLKIQNQEIPALSSHSVRPSTIWWHPTFSPLYEHLDHTNQIFSESLWHPLSTDPPTTHPDSPDPSNLTFYPLYSVFMLMYLTMMTMMNMTTEFAQFTKV